ncbi:hypothetical protein TCAL_08521 [Tigriopus californicus]|uniref:Terpene utilization protein AtuA n=1 Tax=Tigriopus californicus TaxID=6832 RepID=A0A553PJA1_TIGCA|nr:uncharacterized protein LOC131889928 [Tigriopus californicus]TRY77738.1 hypothetical protein TCAL_08521 [Tigriopus californicus]|eukprot:TCALIF_08521-PA protein Name:"Protein of unknown function" AED:0.23 eAED:0.23 QI:84/1/0.5/1/1/1/2/0/633
MLALKTTRLTWGYSSNILFKRGMAKQSVRIGCASGFWGDTPTATPQLLENGRVNYLVYDYLSELTMSLLTAAHKKDPSWGYAMDFVLSGVGRHLKTIKEQEIKVITNAGGINTDACVKALKAACQMSGVELNIAEVQGDNLIHLKENLLKLQTIQEMATGQSLPQTVNSMTAYFGAEPIVKALNMGADIVVTGRTADSALALAPIMHEFEWKLDDYDRLAAGSLAGHLIECGAQATGGTFTDWHLVDGFEYMGFPIVEVQPSGEFILTKPELTGGLVNQYTVGEQLLYEIGDPKNYILPDVICDFSQVQIKDLGADTVLVTGAQGKPPTNSFKISATYMDGYKANCVAIVQGGNATAKARKTAEAILSRSRTLLKLVGLPDFDRHHISILGAEDSFGANALSQEFRGRDAVIWMSVQHQNKTALEILGREIASSGTGMAPGLCGMVGGRPKATPCHKLFSFLYPKEKIAAKIQMNGKVEEIRFSSEGAQFEKRGKPTSSEETYVLPTGKEIYILEDLAYARSGDKGNSCNIGLIARHPSYLPYIKQQVTEQSVAEYFRHLFDIDQQTHIEANVTRFDLPGIHGVNFLIENVLDGGGIASLRPDPLGKSFGQMLLSMELTNLPSLSEMSKVEQK